MHEQLGVISQVDMTTEWFAGLVGNVHICVNFHEAKLKHLSRMVNSPIHRTEPGSAWRYQSVFKAQCQFLVMANQVVQVYTLAHHIHYTILAVLFQSASIWNQLCSTALSEFEQMFTILAGLERVIDMGDRVLVYGQTPSEHDQRLQAVLNHVLQAVMSFKQLC